MPTGSSLRWTRDDIAALSNINDDDLASAIRAWRKRVTPRWLDLVKTGSDASDNEKKRLLLLLAALFAKQFSRESASVSSGRIPIGQWQEKFAGEIKDLHLAVGLAGINGRDNWDDAYRASLTVILFNQYDYLERFARQIEIKRRNARSPEMIGRRAALYGHAGNATYEIMRREAHKRAGYTEEMNLLHIADHCGECVGLSDLGWVKIGTLPAPGSRACVQNCKCSIAYQ